MKKRKKGRRFTISAVRQALEPRAIEMEPEELAIYVRRAEQEVLPIIKKMYLGREAAQFLLAQQAQVLVTGDPHLPPRVGWPSPIASWRSGWRDIARTSVSLHTRRDAAGAIRKAQKKANDEAYFQPFTRANRERPRGIGEVAWGIEQHPQTKLWQIWMMMDGPCTFIVAYGDPVKAQSNIEAISSASRKGGTDAQIAVLYL